MFEAKALKKFNKELQTMYQISYNMSRKERYKQLISDFRNHQCKERSLRS